MTSLTAAFDLFRRGVFGEARTEAIKIVAAEPQNFWAIYLIAVSSAFLGDLKDFEQQLTVLDEFSAKNVYLSYLKAYYALLQNDVEKALWNYLEIADEAEGWLARSLVKKFRKAREIKNIEFRVADFIVLPATLPPPHPLTAQPPFHVVERGLGVRGWRFDSEKKKPRGGWSKRLAIIPYRAVIITAIVFLAIAATYLLLKQKIENQKLIPDMQVADSAAVMPVVDKNKILYTYRTREAIIRDFEDAKVLLKARKVNQCRYLLQRLVYSNADFQTREKARVFIGFIAEPAFTDFNDNVPLKDLFSAMRLRQGSLVVLAGELRDSASEPGGTLYQIIAREGGEEYLVHAFKSDAIKEEKSLAGAKMPVQVYGRYKGLMGPQRAIYLEALRLWR